MTVKTIVDVYDKDILNHIQRKMETNWLWSKPNKANSREWN